MKQQHHPHDFSLLNNGANRDIDKELISLQKGSYIDACNMRYAKSLGDDKSLSKIGGETILYPNIDNRCNNGTGLPLTGEYECIGMTNVNGHIVEFWADAESIKDSLIRIDGQIVCMSPDFDIRTSYPLQMDKNESCVGGEVYITDYNIPPMIFNIEDLMLNSGMTVGGKTGICTEKYFGDFNPNEHSVVLSRALDHPYFLRLTTDITLADKVFGAGGMAVGYYTYSYRYVSASGERTSFTAQTPMIPVVRKLSSDCEDYPYVKTISKDPDVSSPSVYGALVRIRVNNVNNYDYIEVRRDSWYAGDIVGSPAFSEIIGQIDISDGEFNIVDFIDMGGDGQEVLSGTDTTTVMAAIQRAKAIKYFEERLYLMNVAYASRDISATVDMIDENLSTVAFPAIRKIYKYGHNDIWTATYFKSEMRGEINGYGIILWDEQGQWSYAREIGGAENYQYPNRREETSQNTEDVSYFGTAKAANIDNSVSQTHEVFDLANAIYKDDKCSWANILSKGKKSKSKVDNGCGDITGSGWIHSSDIGYSPFRPTSQDDASCSHSDYRVNLSVKWGSASSNKHPYTPQGFELDYYSAGMAFKGVSNLPSWAKAFSIIKTRPANRVIAQGLGYYSMTSAGGAFGVNTGKKVNEFAAYFPDLDDQTGINPSIVDDIKTDPSAYAIQLVSPLGFFTEVYSFNNLDDLATRDTGIDLITYCRILTDNGEINVGEDNQMGFDDGFGKRYVGFGKWRAQTQISTPFQTNNGNQLFDLIGIDDYTEVNGDSKYLRLTVTPSPYSEANANTHINGDHPDVQDWHEPIYVINIIKKNAAIPSDNITNYRYLGHYQKTESVIGISDGSDGQSHILVDERWEDCIPSHPNEIQSGYDTLFKFVFIEDENGNIKRWVCKDNMTPSQINATLSSLTTNGNATVIDSSGSYTVYGMYSHTSSNIGTADIFTIDFDWFDTSHSRDFFIPKIGEKIIVKYDNRVPLRVFGGDTWIGESVWAVKDKVYDKGADPVQNTHDDGDGSGDIFGLNIAFPYRKIWLNPRIYIINRTTGTNRIQNSDTFRFNNSLGTAPASIRQLLAMWTAETRINLCYGFNDEVTKSSLDQFFPLIHYIMHPYQWKDNNFGGSASAVYNDNNIYSQYETDYGDEYLNWGRGGFRFKPQTNIDYSEFDTTKEFTSVPKVGFHEQNLYCTRIIWSEKRGINDQDVQGLGTFFETSHYDISDDTGEIKYAWKANSSNGNNLYAFTERGVCMLLIDKRILSEINGNELATMSSDIGGILKEYWVDKEIGMSDEMWRSASYYSNSIWWSNNESVYSMTNNNIADIGRKKYHSKIYNDYIELLGIGYSDHVTALYDTMNKEYWIGFRKDGSGINNNLGIHHQANNELNVIDYIYDVLQVTNDRDVGIKNNDTIIIDSCSGDPNGIPINIAGTNNMLLSVSTFSICNSCSVPLILRYYSYITKSYVTIATVNQNECYCVFKDIDNKAWTAGVCDPFGQDTSPYNEYNCPTLVFDTDAVTDTNAVGVWIGGFEYDFDRYVSFDNISYGAKNLETYILDSGNIINDKTVTSSVLIGCSVNQPMDKEFIRVRINSNVKPTRIDFFNTFTQALTSNVQAVLDNSNPLFLKDYNGYEQYIPRKSIAPNDRMQGRMLLYKVINDTDDDFVMSSVDIQYKPLK